MARTALTRADRYNRGAIRLHWVIAVLVLTSLFTVPFLPVPRDVGGPAHESHGPLGWLMLLLVVIHIGAALRHRFMLRDWVLARIAPGISARR